MERLDRHDRQVLLRLGYATARAQLFELAMVKLLEQQRHDVSVPLNDRWPEIEEWLMSTAGWIARELQLPEPVAADLRAVTVRRNHVAHHSYRSYLAAKGKDAERAVALYLPWFEQQGEILGLAYNGVMAIVTAFAEGTARDDATIETLWRAQVSTAVEDLTVPTV